MSRLAFLSQSSRPTPDQARDVFAALETRTSTIELDRFGWSYVAHDRAFSFVPWDDAAAGPQGNPLLFVDESYDESTRTTLYAGLVLTPGAAFTLAGWYLGNLVTLRRQVPAFWPVDAPPARMHFRELFNEHARQKTTWRTLPNQGIRDLVAIVADALGENEQVHPFVGIVHRDLKPGNVLLTKAGGKLLDFGDNEQSPTSRQTASVVAGSTPDRAPRIGFRPWSGSPPVSSTEERRPGRRRVGTPATARQS